MRKIVLFSLIFLLIDQLSKLLIVNNFKLNDSYEVISSFFSLTYVKNYGAAFSILQDSRYFLIVVSLLLLFVIFRFFLVKRTFLKKETILYAILIGGILGNLIDRIIHGYVIDFLAFQFGKYSFPVFNFADIFIVCSVFYIVIFTDWSHEYEDKSK